MDFSNVFGKIGAAEVTQRSDDPKEGDYLLEVVETTLFAGNNGPTHKVKFIVREAKQKGESPPSTVGSEIGMVNVFAGKTAKVSPGKVKGYTIALFGPNAEALDAAKLAALVEESCSAKNPTKGMLVRGSSVNWTSAAGVKGISLNFTHVPGQTKAEIAARAAAQG